MIKHLKQHGNKLLIGFLLLFGAGFLHGQTGVKLNLMDNSELNFTVETSGKLWFDNNHLIINADNVLTQESIPLSNIRKITFVEPGTTDLSELALHAETILIYPNPANDNFNLLSSCTDKLNVRIFNTNGEQVANGSYESGNSIDISHLNAGLYVIIVNNQSFKLIKQ